MDVETHVDMERRDPVCSLPVQTPQKSFVKTLLRMVA